MSALFCVWDGLCGERNAGTVSRVRGVSRDGAWRKGKWRYDRVLSAGCGGRSVECTGKMQFALFVGLNIKKNTVFFTCI